MLKGKTSRSNSKKSLVSILAGLLAVAVIFAIAEGIYISQLVSSKQDDGVFSVLYEYPEGLKDEYRETFDKAVTNMREFTAGGERVSNLGELINSFIATTLFASYDYSTTPVHYQVLDYGVTDDNNFFIKFKFNCIREDNGELVVDQVGTVYFWEDSDEPGEFSYAYSYED